MLELLEVKLMDGIVRLKTEFEQIADINLEITNLCIEKNMLASEYNEQVSEINRKLDALRQQRTQLSLQMEGKL